MQEAMIYSLQKLNKSHLRADYFRRLVFQNRPLRTFVNGDEVTLQLAYGEYVLLVTRYSFYEGDAHWFYLLSHGKIVDWLALPDDTGFMVDLVIFPGDITFRLYATSIQWQLVIKEDGYWSFTVDALRNRPVRYWLTKRRLVLRRLAT